LESSEIVRTLQGLAPHDHAVLFYSDIHAKRQLIFPFLHGALQNQGVTAYVTAHEPLDEVRDAMKRWEIDVDRHESDGNLLIADYQAVTTREGRLDDFKISEWLGILAKHGGPVRIAADPTLLVKRGMVDEILRRERILQRRLELPITMVCQYEDTVAGIREGEFLVEMLHTHSHAIFPGIALILT